MELKGRRRKRGETVQALYQDVTCLVSLGYPGKSGSLCDLIARDAFLDSLNDSSLRIRVLEKEPPTIDAALAIVCRLEAYGIVDVQDRDDEANRRRVRSVNADSSADCRIKDLEKLQEQKKLVKQLQGDAKIEYPMGNGGVPSDVLRTFAGHGCQNLVYVRHGTQVVELRII